MGHELQIRYSNLVDKKMRSTLATAYCFNTRYEGTPTAGAVKIPSRPLEVSARAYDRAKGLDLESGATAYITLPINKDYAVNELIDGYEAAAVPDGIVADRLDSAGYSLAKTLDSDGVHTLEQQGKRHGDASALTKNTVYNAFVDLRTALSDAGVPSDGRFALVSPSVFALVLKSPEFISASNLGDEIKQSGALGRIAGFNLFESNNLTDTTEIIAGHPDWCHRVEEWISGVKVVSLEQSGQFIGASAVQGRKVYGHIVSNSDAVLIKSTAPLEPDADTGEETA